MPIKAEFIEQNRTEQNIPNLKKSQSINTFHNERKKVFETMCVLESTRKDKIKSYSFRPVIKFISSRGCHYFFDVICCLYHKEQE